MDKTNKLSSFLSEDVAYFLGLVVGRGKLLAPRGDQCRVTVDFPFRSLKVDENLMAAATGLGGDEVFLYLSNSVDVIVERVRDIGFDARKQANRENRSVGITADGLNTGIAARFLKYLVNDEYNDYHSFRIPRSIFESDRENRKEFLRGYFDVTGHARTSNVAFGNANRHRIYLEVDHENWFLPLDLSKLLDSVGVPVQNVNFGHPNLRDPNNRGKAWAKEHQLKIYANEFEPVGSYLEHKRKAIVCLADMNRVGGKAPSAAAQNMRVNEKPAHPDEKSDKLPAFIRGRHFNHYTELLAALEEADEVRAYE